MPYGTAMGVVPVLLACSGGASCLVWHLLPGLSMCPGEPIAASSSYRDRQAVLPPGSGEPIVSLLISLLTTNGNDRQLVHPSHRYHEELTNADTGCAV